MSQTEKEYIIEKAKELMAAPSCCQEAKDAVAAWIAAVGTEKEAESKRNGDQSMITVPFFYFMSLVLYHLFYATLTHPDLLFR